MEEVKSTNNIGDMEILLQTIDNSIERLKAEYNLFFSGDIRVPPEQERERLEKKVRDIFYNGRKSPRLTLLIQNVSAKFTLYNNMWLKRLNEVEGGIIRGIKKPRVIIKKEIIKAKKNTIVNVSLNQENSFDDFYEQYKKLSLQQSAKIMGKERMINSIKTKLITANLIDVKIDFQIEKGKVKLKIRRQ